MVDIQENGKKVKHKEREYIIGMTEKNLQVTEKKVKQKVKENIFYLNGSKYEGDWKEGKKEGNGIYYYYNMKCMKVNGKMINLMGRENTLISMVINMKVNGGIFDY